ncbi:uncharacterized protein LOC122067056 isoform X2 [Macadamia integrifolia]|uniref:uncharacterized protein LOC122067056 isoform X2 n=1 Tax=Macadamia integrifolia TaxID=60698 RepID=UPI001C4F8B28|nr:uncharacterized protein LOC122067056 isoform X2 [Macadamia integrifolia]
METTTYRSEGEAGEGMRMQQEQAMVEVEKKQMKVMVAIDESEESFHALKWALDHLFFFMPSSSSSAGGVAAAEAELTQNQEHGMVILVHVQQPFHYYIAPAGPGSMFKDLGCCLHMVNFEKGSVRSQDRIQSLYDHLVVQVFNTYFVSCHYMGEETNGTDVGCLLFD